MPFFAPPSPLFARGLTLPIHHLLHIPDRRSTAGIATYYADPTIPSPALPDYPSLSGSLAFLLFARLFASPALRCCFILSSESSSSTDPHLCEYLPWVFGPGGLFVCGFPSHPVFGG